MLEISEVLPTPAKSVAVGAGRFGGSYTQVASAQVEFARGPVVEATIWARLTINRDTGQQDIVIEPGMPKQTKFNSQEELDEFKTLVLEHMQVWVGWNAAQTKAIQRLTNPASQTSSTKITYSVPKGGKPVSDEQ